jgi:hypothetical protein
MAYVWQTGARQVLLQSCQAAHMSPLPYLAVEQPLAFHQCLVLYSSGSANQQLVSQGRHQERIPVRYACFLVVTVQCSAST